MIELVIGGARSGKSSYAERQALASGLRVIYLATAQALDGVEGEEELADEGIEHGGAFYRIAARDWEAPGHHISQQTA